MRKSIIALVAAAALGGFAASSMAAEPTPEEQTSTEQVKMCMSGIEQCKAGDTQGCVVALKTCVGEQRQKAMMAMEQS
jgi:hypothetical protein